MNQNAMYFECHYCMLFKDRTDPKSFLAKCCIKRCNKNYCIQCIKNQFDPTFQSHMYKKDTWICYFCQTTCTCSRCKMSDSLQLQKKKSKKNISRNNSSISPALARDESVENSLSVSNPSQKISDYSGTPLFLNNSQNQSANNPENKSQTQKIESISQINIVTDEEIKKLPPFMKKIIERKNMFYNFVLNSAKSQINHANIQGNVENISFQKKTKPESQEKEIIKIERMKDNEPEIEYKPEDEHENEEKVEKQQKTSKDKYKKMISQALREHQSASDDFQFID